MQNSLNGGMDVTIAMEPTSVALAWPAMPSGD